MDRLAAAIDRFRGQLDAALALVRKFLDWDRALLPSLLRYQVPRWPEHLLTRHDAAELETLVRSRASGKSTGTVNSRLSLLFGRVAWARNSMVNRPASSRHVPSGACCSTMTFCTAGAKLCTMNWSCHAPHTGVATTAMPAAC